MSKLESVRPMVLSVILLLTSLAFSTALAQDNISSVTIAASPEGLTVPETIPAGWVELSFENTSEIPLFSIVGRLDDDATMDEFMEALMVIMGGDASFVPPATFLGSPITMPGTTEAATYSLEAGNYVLLNVAGEEPDIATFVVEGDVAESDFVLEADLDVALVDFAFGMPTELQAGEQTWSIENTGEQWHEMVFIPVPDGTTLEDAMAMLMAEDAESEEGEMPEIAVAWTPMSSGEKAWIDVDLAPGTYLVSCFIEDVNSEEHAMHAELGMIQIVNVIE